MMAYFILFSNDRLQTALLESFLMVQEYVREYVFRCFVPVFFIAGFLLGRFGHQTLISNQWVEILVGDNNFRANLFASASGRLMYFAALTETPILQGLIGSGMGKCPVLSPEYVCNKREHNRHKKTLVYVVLVVVMATASGMIYGKIFA